VFAAFVISRLQVTYRKLKLARPLRPLNSQTPLIVQVFASFVISRLQVAYRKLKLARPLRPLTSQTPLTPYCLLLTAYCLLLYIDCINNHIDENFMNTEAVLVVYTVQNCNQSINQKYRKS
jgi:hypothetical protein